jgi:hypothetical protein
MKKGVTQFTLDLQRRLLFADSLPSGEPILSLN